MESPCPRGRKQICRRWPGPESSCITGAYNTNKICTGSNYPCVLRSASTQWSSVACNVPIILFKLPTSSNLSILVRHNVYNATFPLFGVCILKESSEKEVLSPHISLIDAHNTAIISSGSCSVPVERLCPDLYIAHTYALANQKSICLRQFVLTSIYLATVHARPDSITAIIAPRRVSLKVCCCAFISLST